MRAFACALLASTLSTAVASAQSSSVLAAEAKFSEGVRLMKAGRCEQALPNFRASQELDPASGTLLNIAYCEVRLGKTATAWFVYRKALALAESNARPQHERLARQEIEKLEPELPYLNVELERDAAPRLRVELDGNALEPAVWSVETPVDPGAHSVRVFHRGTLTWENNFSISARERRVLRVPASALTDASPTETVASTSFGAGSASLASPIVEARGAPERPSRSTAATAVTLGSAGIGVVALVAASVLFAGARHDYDEVDSQCPSNACQTRASYDQRMAAVRRFHWSLGVGASGIGLLGVAAAVWFGSKPSDKPTAERVSVDVDSAQFGVSWQRAF